MLRKVVLGLLLLAGLALVGGYLIQAGKPKATPTAVSMDPAAPTPASTAASVDPTPCDTCPGKEQPTATDAPTPALPVAAFPGAQAPDFTLTDLDGNEVSLYGLRGQVVLINFWATW